MEKLHTILLLILLAFILFLCASCASTTTRSLELNYEGAGVRYSWGSGYAK